MPARTPEEIHTLLAAAFNAGDLDAFIALHEDHATTVVPPDGRRVTGHAAIRAALAPVFASGPRARIEAIGKLQSGGLALTRARLDVVVPGPDPAHPLEVTGQGTIVSRRQPDGTWRIVIDDPMGPGRTTPAPVVVADPDPGRHDAFAAERRRIAAVLGDEAAAIEHIGSTAVPGLPAKPIIDIAVGLRDGADAARCVPALAALEYRRDPSGDFDGRVFLRRVGSDGGPSHHVSLTPHGSDRLLKHVAFPDALRADRRP
jgi:GrpB-like predicted nucleotidyltransferase (UPF0157 family)